jgi:hypothetical protein
LFVENFNGTSFILDDTWLSNFDMQLFTDSAGGMGKGCWCYLFGKWSILQWPVEWYHADILKDINSCISKLDSHVSSRIKDVPLKFSINIFHIIKSLNISFVILIK